MDINQEKVNQETQRSLGRIEGKLDGICGDISSIRNHLSTINGKVGKNEQDIAGIKGRAAMLGGIASTLVIIVWEYIKNKL